MYLWLKSAEKNLEIERNNISLFNRIASIIREKPKIEHPRTRNFVKSLDEATLQKERRQEELKAKNQILERRILHQQPTINNNSILRERLRNQNYLRLIGRRINTESGAALNVFDGSQEVFHQKSRDFDIRIIKQGEKQEEYVFCVRELDGPREHRLSMPTEIFRKELGQCNLSFEAMVANLRMSKQGEMVYSPSEDFNSK